jgi:hypothetical protein
MEREFYKKRKLEQRGWKAMTEILDREMPVEQKRRRFVAWWWFAGLLLLGSGIVWRALQTPPVAPTQHAAPVIPPVATAPGAPASPAITTPIPTASPSSADRSVPVVSGQVTTPTPSSGQPTQPNRIETKTGAPIRIVAPKAPPVVAASDRTMPLAVPTVGEASGALYPAPANISPSPTAIDNNTVAANPAPANMSPSPAAIDNNTVDALALLQGRGPWGLPVELLVPGLDSVDYTPIKTVTTLKSWPEPRWRGGASVGFVTRHFTEVSGAIAGFNMDRQLSKRWGVRGGIHYAYHQHLVQDVQNLAIHYGTYKGNIQQHGFDTQTTVGTTNAIPPNEEVHLSIIESHRIEAPLMVFWQPTKRWRGYAGVYLGRILHIKTGNPTLPEQNQRTAAVNDPSLTFDSAKQAANRYVNAEWPRWASGVMYGIGFRPSKGMEINLDYQNASGWVNRSVNRNFDAVIAPPSYTAARGRVPGRFQLSATWFLDSK